MGFHNGTLRSIKSHLHFSTPHPQFLDISSMVENCVTSIKKSYNLKYSHLFNKRGGWNKRGGGAKVANSLNVEAGINMEGGIFRKKLVHKSNKRGVEGGKI